MLTSASGPCSGFDEPSPRGIAELLATFLRGVELLRETIEIDLAGGFEDGFFLVFLELF